MTGKGGLVFLLFKRKLGRLGEWAKVWKGLGSGLGRCVGLDWLF